MAGALLLLALWVPSAASGQAYQIVDLGVGPPYFPTALNNRGQILLTNNSLTPARIGLLLASGAIYPRWSGPASLLWDNGSTTSIGLLPGGTFSRGCGLNDAGQVAGFGDTKTPYSTCPMLEDPSRTWHAFVGQGGVADLDPGLEVEGQDGTKCTVFVLPSLALGINNQGQVTGWFGTPLPGTDYKEGSTHVFRTSGGQIDREADDLTPGDKAITQGWFINNAGTVLGTQLGGGYAFFGGGGGPPSAGGIVYAMNDSGTTVGVAGGKAFASSGTLPSPFEAALGINNQGQIVGQGTIGDRQHALLYSDGQVIDLDGSLPTGSGWELFQAALINDQGQIVVWGSHKGQETLGLLTPVQISLTVSDKEISSDDGGATGTVTLSLPAPAGGTVVALKAVDPRQLDRLFVPDTVQIPEGKTSAQFPIVPDKVEIWHNDVAFTIKAGVGGPGQSQELTVRPTIHNLYLEVDPLFGAKGGSPVTGTITLSLPAPAGGRAVTVSNSNPAVAAINASAATQMGLVVPAGQTTLDFTIQTQPVTAPAEVEITAQTPTSEQTRSFGVHP